MDKKECFGAGTEAAEQLCAGRLRRTGPLLRQLRLWQRQLERRIQQTCGDCRPGDPERWLLDNQYLVQLAAQNAEEGFRRVRRLPGLEGTEDEYRLIGLARAAMEQPELLSQQGLVAFLNGVQSVAPIWERELRVLLPALQYTALEQLSCVLKETDQAREIAYSRVFTALRQWNDLDFQMAAEQASLVHAAFMQDATGDYAKMPARDRARYRLQLERQAIGAGAGEGELALDIVKQSGANHIGFLLFKGPSIPRKVLQTLYFPGLTLVSLFLSLWLAFSVGVSGSFLLLWLPVFQILKAVSDTVLLRFLPRRPVFRLTLSGGLTQAERTLVVKTAILSEDSCMEEIRQLECIFLANRDCGQELSLGILADLPERDTPVCQRDRDRLDRAKSALDELNRRYGGRFFLFFRTPAYQGGQGTFAGWERKRGALLELARMLRARRSGIEVYSGDRTHLNSVRFLITLDSDTDPGVGGLRPLVGAMCHPLNRPQLDLTGRVVTKGYAIIQPQIRTGLAAARATPFARLMSGGAGSDPYRGSGSELCHDLFDESSFCGKGILDIDCFLACLDGRFPEQTVLSHDILEGAFLRTGYLSQISFSDGFPSGVRGFYKRQHRWVRGDWQNFPWILGRIPTGAGREPNPLSGVSRWKLADNLRRSLTPVAQLVCLFVGIALGGPVGWLGWTALGAVLLEPLLAFLTGLFSRPMMRRYHTRVWSGAGQMLLQILVRLTLLPLEAWTNLSALAVALWRSLVSHKNMLQWTTFAQQGVDGGPVRTSVPILLAGLVLALTALAVRTPLGAALAILWLLSPAIVWGLERKMPAPGLRAQERAFLLHEAEQIWGFFADFLTRERNYLPPDNVQLRPYQGPAERTSPTNIGFAALSCLSALDLDLEQRETVLERISGMLDTLERLEKWRGNLYNWYHTVSLDPLEPKVVSSVDSGNLCACLLALAVGLRAQKQNDLAERALVLARETDLGALYDRKKHLFYISYEPDTGTWSDSHYDLMASEARLLSYVALALGQVEHRHWAALSRAQTASHGYQGMVSWFGTMFEYFMPHLLLPLPEGSFLYESVAFCACEQICFGQKRRIPWGISESAVPDLDRNSCYSYRANGIPAAALCHMPERQPVVAPYATYLTLSILPHRAVDNLRRLRANGLEGKYGLYEAAEYGQNGIRAARSWMSHHMGMSLVAIDNALQDQIQIRRLMALPELRAFQSLLEEEVPRGARPLRARRAETAREREKAAVHTWQISGTGVSQENPVCVLLAGTNLSCVVTNAGYGWLNAGGESLTARRSPPAFYLKRKNRIYTLFPSASGADLRWNLGEKRCEFRTQVLGLQLQLTITLDPSGALEWMLELSGCFADDVLLFFLGPQLASERDFLAHPAFSLLRIETEHTAGGVTFRRRGEGSRHPELRCRWLGPGIRCVTGHEASVRLAELGLSGGEPGLLLEMPMDSGGKKPIRMTVRLDTGETAVPSGPVKAAVPGDLELVSRLLPELLFAPQLGREGVPGPQQSLWSFGISGDDPIVLSPVPLKKDLFCSILRVRHMLICGGIPFDLVFLAEESASERFQRWTEEQGLALGGQRGIHFVPADQNNEALMRGMACAGLDLLPERKTCFEVSGELTGTPVPDGTKLTLRWNGTQVALLGGLPPVRWSMPLSNGSFGYLAADTGGGYLWSRNARLFRITPWDNDPQALEGPENLTVMFQGRQQSLFARRDGLPCTLTFGPGFLRWEKEFGNGFCSIVTAFVPQGRNERVFLLTVRNCPPDAELCWQLKPQMGEYVSQSLWGRAWESDGRIWLENPVAERSGICLSASVPWQRTCLPSGRRRGVELFFAPTDTLVLQAGEPCETLTPEQACQLLSKTEAYWRSQCGGLAVETPDPGLNHYLSFWGQYQVQVSRMLSRTSIYQCGGAYGFRDQLQDCCALIQTNPAMVREHILRCCRHQFAEGDVLHWWHEQPCGGTDAGVRTHITDDLLWLPYALSVWWEETGDMALLEQESPYLSGPRLSAEEHDRYFAPRLDGAPERVYCHGIRAIECVLGRGVGAHGLCKMGSGDWNDGMDQVGAAGRGESVWLTWFAALVLRRYAAVCEAMKEDQRARRYRTTADKLSQAAERCWDGGWFLRGYFDGGEALGGKDCPECRIDSISQSFAALVCQDRRKTRMALENAQAMLLDEFSGTVALLDPAFDGKGPDPGYIAQYRPGNRENGGQYTHAAVWLALAWFHLGEPDRGWNILRTLLPEHHPLERYQAEPFVLAADVCREQGKEGVAGWSWYTGAAGWYWRVAVQELLGIQFRAGLLYLKPALPNDWPGYRAELQLEQGKLEIQVSYGQKTQLLLDGQMVSQGIDCSALTGLHSLRLEILRKRGCATEQNHV